MRWGVCGRIPHDPRGHSHTDLVAQAQSLGVDDEHDREQLAALQAERAAMEAVGACVRDADLYAARCYTLPTFGCRAFAAR